MRSLWWWRLFRSRPAHTCTSSISSNNNNAASPNPAVACRRITTATMPPGAPIPPRPPRPPPSQQKQSQTRPKKPLAAPPRPSASVVLLSPTNQVLLLHRVQTSTSFASAHVFPGGNVDAFHDGDVPPEGHPDRHADGPAYRMAAVRETFEEAGILLAKRKDGEQLLRLSGLMSAEEKDAARRRVHGSGVAFAEWLESVGGVADVDGLVPVTRWITPPNRPKRFSTQMYLYMLPLEQPEAPGTVPSETHVPTVDGGIEHTAATFAPPSSFLARAATGDIVIFPPQVFLLHLLSRFIPATLSSSSSAPSVEDLAAQREQLLDFIARVPAADTPRGAEHPTASIPWGDKAISPHVLLVRESDGRSVLGLDRPGGELKGSGRGGDWERVVVVRFGKGGPTHVEVRRREDVLEEERRSEVGNESKL